MGTPRIDGTFTSGQPAVVGYSPQGPELAVFNNLLYISWTGANHQVNILSSEDGQNFY